MKVERIDLYDFKVILTEEDFKKVKRIADVSGISLELAFTTIVVNGLHFELEDIFNKE